MRPLSPGRRPTPSRTCSTCWPSTRASRPAARRGPARLGARGVGGGGRPARRPARARPRGLAVGQGGAGPQAPWPGRAARGPRLARGAGRRPGTSLASRCWAPSPCSPWPRRRPRTPAELRQVRGLPPFVRDRPARPAGRRRPRPRGARRAAALGSRSRPARPAVTDAPEAARDRAAAWREEEAEALGARRLGGPSPAAHRQAGRGGPRGPRGAGRDRGPPPLAARGLRPRRPAPGPARRLLTGRYHGRLVTTLGKFELLGELGRGAMGTVYRARDPALDRLVALKTVAPGPARAARVARALRARGAGGGQAPAPQHRHRLRAGRGPGRHPLHRHGAARGHGPRPAHGRAPRRSPATRRCGWWSTSAAASTTPTSRAWSTAT